MDRVIMLGTNFRIRANEEEGACYIEMYDAGTGQWIKLLTVNAETIFDTKGTKLSLHGSEHSATGADPITNIDYTQLSTNTIYFYIPVPIPDSVQSGLDTSSTGTKWTSNFNIPWDKRHIKKVGIRARISNPGGATIRIVFFDRTTNKEILSLTYSGTEGEMETSTEDLSNMSESGPGYVYAEVTGTGTTTFDIHYVLVWFEVGIA